MHLAGVFRARHHVQRRPLQHLYQAGQDKSARRTVQRQWRAVRLPGPYFIQGLPVGWQIGEEMRES